MALCVYVLGVCPELWVVVAREVILKSHPCPEVWTNPTRAPERQAAHLPLCSLEPPNMEKPVQAREWPFASFSTILFFLFLEHLPSVTSTDPFPLFNEWSV